MKCTKKHNILRGPSVRRAENADAKHYINATAAVVISRHRISSVRPCALIWIGLIYQRAISGRKNNAATNSHGYRRGCVSGAHLGHYTE